ncbi:hypothetical protein SAVIM40S_07640 [Streptomyces avidinii]
METNAPKASTASVASGWARIHCRVGANRPRSVVTRIRYGLTRRRALRRGVGVLSQRDAGARAPAAPAPRTPP